MDSWPECHSVESLIDGSEIIALQVASVQLKVDHQIFTQKNNPNDKALLFEIRLAKGEHKVADQILNGKGKLIEGTYYTYVSFINRSLHF